MFSIQLLSVPKSTKGALLSNIFRTCLLLSISLGFETIFLEAAAFGDSAIEPRTNLELVFFFSLTVSSSFNYLLN